MAEILVSGPSHPSYRTQQACCNCKHVEWTWDHDDPRCWFCNVLGQIDLETPSGSGNVWEAIEVHPHDICDLYIAGEETCRTVKEIVND